MVIVDTSVWVDWMRQPNDRFASWMSADVILQHPFVTAELSMGSFQSKRDRNLLVDLLESFEQIEPVDQPIFNDFVAEHTLFGTGIGFADAHLLIAGMSHSDMRLATRDKRLALQASRLGIAVVD